MSLPDLGRLSLPTDGQGGSGHVVLEGELQEKIANEVNSEVWNLTFEFASGERFPRATIRWFTPYDRNWSPLHTACLSDVASEDTVLKVVKPAVLSFFERLLVDDMHHKVTTKSPDGFDHGTIQITREGTLELFVTHDEHDELMQMIMSVIEPEDDWWLGIWYVNTSRSLDNESDDSGFNLTDAYYDRVEFNVAEKRIDTQRFFAMCFNLIVDDVPLISLMPRNWRWNQSYSDFNYGFMFLIFDQFIKTQGWEVRSYDLSDWWRDAPRKVLAKRPPVMPLNRSMLDAQRVQKGILPGWMTSEDAERVRRLAAGRFAVLSDLEEALEGVSEEGNSGV